jgi:hypothetical protein
MRCFQCGKGNSKQDFCGACGAPLHLDSFIAHQVKEQLSKNTKDRDLIERESAIRVFEKAYGWMKLLGKIAAAIIVVVAVPLAAIGINKWSDLTSTISAAKQGVVRTADEQRRAIEATSASAQKAVGEISSNANRQGRVAVQEAAAAKLQIAKQTLEVRNEVDGLHKEIEEAGKLQPEMIAIREELTRHQKVLSSSEEFARSIFSSHRVDFFQPEQSPADHYRILPRAKGNGATVYLLLNRVPIAETLQLQFHIFSQPSNSYVTIHNLVVFSWGDPAETLKAHQLSASYFPDKQTGT